VTSLLRPVAALAAVALLAAGCGDDDGDGGATTSDAATSDAATSDAATSDAANADGDDPALDTLWDACEAGDGAACYELYLESPAGSEYEEFGETCGNRMDAGVDCVEELDTEAAPPDAAMSDAEIAAALADLDQLLDSTPERIAQDMSRFGFSQVTADEVRSVARNLCSSYFDPTVVTAWLDSKTSPTNIFMVGPANRLLRYSGTQAVCAQEPTSTQRAAYERELYSFLAAQSPGFPTTTIPSGLTPVANGVTGLVCGVLESQAGDDIVEGAFRGFMRLASRGRWQPGEFLPIAAAVVASGCKIWLEPMIDVVDRYFGP
jgi:hypothetical protein